MALHNEKTRSYMAETNAIPTPGQSEYQLDEKLRLAGLLERLEAQLAMANQYYEQEVARSPVIDGTTGLSGHCFTMNQTLQQAKRELKKLLL